MTITDVAAGLRTVTDQIAQRAEALGLATPSPDQRAPHMLGIGLPPEAAQAAARHLKDEGVVASVRGSSLRIAPHLHTNQDDIDRLLSALTR